MWPDKAIVKMFIKNAPAFAAAGIMVKALNSLDVVLVQNVTGAFNNVGLYSIPLKLINAVSLTLPTALMGVLYPAFSHLYGKSEEGLKTVFRLAVNYLLIIAIPMSIGFFALGDEFIGALWTSEYGAAIMPAKIMILSLPFIFVAFPTGNMLNAIGKQKYTALSRAIGLATMVALDVILIRRHGLMGAAYGLLGTHAVILASDVFFLRNLIASLVKSASAQVGKILVSSLVMYGMLYAFSGVIPWYALALLGGSVYFACLFALKGIDLGFFRHLT
jgi:O-antigen/teichoic acid export membrane protein